MKRAATADQPWAACLDAACLALTILSSPKNDTDSDTKKKVINMNATGTALASLALLAATMPSARAWDSISPANRTHPTHSYLTEHAIEQQKSNFPEVETFREALIDGASTEVHELPLKFGDQALKFGAKYDLSIESLRLAHRGTNEGSDDVEGWFKDAYRLYHSGHKRQAYYLIGVVLHMIQDMGVPAHANRVYHQGTVSEFDNFEFISLWNWKPDWKSINKANPDLKDPWKYYAFSESWTREDAPNYKSRNSFAKFWGTASATERRLVRQRQARTATTTSWALRSACNALSVAPQPTLKVSASPSRITLYYASPDDVAARGALRPPVNLRATGEADIVVTAVHPTTGAIVRGTVSGGGTTVPTGVRFHARFISVKQTNGTWSPVTLSVSAPGFETTTIPLTLTLLPAE